MPRKRARTYCIIHCTDEDSQSLVSPKDFGSWKALLRAAEIWKHDPILNISKELTEGEIPPVQYHRKCRSIFTMKRLLDNITTNQEANQSQTLQDESTARRPSRDLPSTSRVYDAVCIFCQKSSKYLKGQKTREALIQCQELRADSRVRDIATKRLDQRILAIVSRELVAAEGHYHRSCYRLYTKEVTTVNSVSKHEEPDTEENHYQEIERCAYDKLLAYIRHELIPNPKVLPMTDLTSRLQSYMTAYGIDQVRESTKKHLRRKLESELGGCLHVISNEKGKLLIYPDSLAINDLVRETHSLRKELEGV